MNHKPLISAVALSALMVNLMPDAHAIAFDPGTSNTFTVCSIADTNTRGFSGSGWGLNGSRMTNLVSKLSDPALFGPGGSVPYSVNVVTGFTAPGSITGTSLDAAGCNILFDGFMPDSAFQAAELTEIVNWATSGNGYVIDTADSNSYDAISAAFGYPVSGNTTNSSDFTITNIDHPAFACGLPAPTAGDQIEAKWWSGWVAPTTPNMAVFATHNANGNAGIFESTGDNFVFVGDVDVFSNEQGALGGISAAAGVNNTNDQLVLNLFAYAALAPGGFVLPTDTNCDPSSATVTKTAVQIYDSSGAAKGVSATAYSGDTVQFQIAYDVTNGPVDITDYFVASAFTLVDTATYDTTNGYTVTTFDVGSNSVLDTVLTWDLDGTGVLDVYLQVN